MNEQDRHELESLRSSINDVDDVILNALAQRAALARKVSALKAKSGEPTHDLRSNRDRVLLERIEQKGAGEFPKRALSAVFREITEACAGLEAPIRVAYEGPPGSPSHEAARKRFGAAANYLPCEGPAAAIELVQREHADVAMVMFESSSEGLLQPALDALTAHDLKIVSEIEVDARVHVLNKTGTIQEIEKIYAAPHERNAAARFLANNVPKATIVDTNTAAIAAQMAAQEPNAAALGGSSIAEMFGLEIARGNIADSIGEHIRCVVLSRRPAQRTGQGDVTAIMFGLDDSPGALFRSLKPFVERDINIHRIQSRPSSVRTDHHSARPSRVFLEVEGHSTDRPLITAFEELKRVAKQLKILGSYTSKS